MLASVWTASLWLVISIGLAALTLAQLRSEPYGAMTDVPPLPPPPPSALTHDSREDYSGTQQEGPEDMAENDNLRPSDRAWRSSSPGDRQARPRDDDLCKYDWCNAGEYKPICVVYFTNYHRAFTLRNQKCVEFNNRCVKHLGTMAWCHEGNCYDDSIKFCNPPD